MISPIIQRLFQGFLVLLVLYTITFLLVRSLPGDPFAEDKAIPEEVRERQREQYGLDQPWHVQYPTRLGQILSGDFAYSTLYKGREVREIVRQAFPTSFLLGCFAMVIAVLIGLPTGVLAASRKNSLLDYSAMALAMVGICLPGFVIGPIFAEMFGRKFQLLPASGWGGIFSFGWILPAVTLGLLNAAYISRLTRAGMLDTLNQDFIRTAKAKGVSQFQILSRHALRGGLIPAVAYLGPAFAATISGSVVVERIFHLPGMGLQFIKAIEKNDPFLIEASVLLYGFLIVIAVLLTDILQLFLNPRLRKS